MIQGKRSPVLFTGVMLTAAALAMACSSSNNNNTKTTVPTTAATRAGTSAPVAPAAGSPTRAAASPAAAGSPAAAARPADIAADDAQKVTLNLGAEPQYLDPQISNFQQDYRGRASPLARFVLLRQGHQHRSRPGDRGAGQGQRRHLRLMA